MLRAAEIDVVGLDNGLFRNCAIGPVEAVPAIAKDIRDVEPRDVESFDAVIHLAGLSSKALGQVHPAITFEVNFEATLRLAQLAKQAGVRRFLFASSGTVHGLAAATRDQFAAPAPNCPYAVSKALAEAELTRLAGGGFSPVFLRAANPYGVSPMLRFEPVLNNLVAQAAVTGRILIEGDGTRRFALIHVEDLARAYLAALLAPERAVHRQAFNLGGAGECHAMAQLAAFVRETVPGAEIGAATKPGLPIDHGPAKSGTSGRILTAYRPRWTARRGAVEIYEAIRRLGLRRDDIDGARCSRVDHLKMLVRLGRMDDELRLVSQAPPSAAARTG